MKMNMKTKNKKTERTLIALTLSLTIFSFSFACKPRPKPPTFTMSAKQTSDLEQEPEWNDEPEELGTETDPLEGEPEEGEGGEGTQTGKDPVGEGIDKGTSTPKDDKPATNPPGEKPVTENPPKTTPDPKPEPVDPNKKLEVKVQGRQLLVGGKPFHMRGVCYSPIPKGKRYEDGPLFANPDDNALKALEKDFQMMADAGINTIRPYSVIENDKVLSLLNKYGIFVIVPVLSGHDVKMDEVKRIVNKLKNHRSTLMWQVGNEWNYNLLYGAPNFEAAKNVVKAAGAAVKSVDKTIPLASNWGEMIDPNLVKELSDYDIWGMNIYAGKTFGDRFEKYKQLTGKPLFIGEFGADAFNRKINGPDLEAQAVATHDLIRELDANSSATSPDKAAMGGAIFEWNDEWWKDGKGSPSVQDRGGIAPGGGPWPDLEFNEEWWGIVDIDRNPRPAYQKLKALWKK